MAKGDDSRGGWKNRETLIVWGWVYNKDRNHWMEVTIDALEEFGPRSAAAVSYVADTLQNTMEKGANLNTPSPYYELAAAALDRVDWKDIAKNLVARAYSGVE